MVSIDDQPWFVAKDVCEALDYPRTSHGWVVDKLDATERTLKQIQKGVRSVVLISESGLYKLVMRSDKPQAKAFQDWVTKEVLPSIRKTGSYVTGQPSLVEHPKMSALQLARAQMDSMQAIFTALEEQERTCSLPLWRVGKPLHHPEHGRCNLSCSA